MGVHQTFHFFFINVSLFAPCVHGTVCIVRDPPFIDELGQIFLEFWEIVASNIFPLSKNFHSDWVQNHPPVADIKLQWTNLCSEMLPNCCADNGSHVVVVLFVWLVLGSAGG